MGRRQRIDLFNGMSKEHIPYLCNVNDYILVFLHYVHFQSVESRFLPLRQVFLSYTFEYFSVLMLFSISRTTIKHLFHLLSLPFHFAQLSKACRHTPY